MNHDLDTLLQTYQPCIPPTVYIAILRAVTGISFTFDQWCDVFTRCNIPCPDTCPSYHHNHCDSVLEAYQLYLHLISLYDVGDSAQALSDIFSAYYGYYIPSGLAWVWIPKCDTNRTART